MTDVDASFGQTAPLVAHIVFRLDFGGLENGLVNLINRLPKQSFRHVIICLKDFTDFRDRIDGEVEVFALHKREGQDFRVYWRLWRLFRRLKPDIVHTRNLATLEAQFPAWLAGVSHRVHGEHGRDIHDVDNTKRRYRWLRKLFRPLVGRYIPLSADLAAYLQDEVGVPSTKVVKICNGVDTDKFSPGKHAALTAPFDLNNSIVIGTVGRMEAVKDQVTLAHAFVELTKRIGTAFEQQVVLVMVGDGSQRDRISAILKEASLEQLAWLPGSRNDVEQLMRSYDIFVLPSLAEGISNTILEAMASGLPVVATDVGGNNELVQEGVTGLLVPRAQPMAMAEALLKYVNSGELRTQHGAAARARVLANFSLDGMADCYGQVYRDLLQA